MATETPSKADSSPRPSRSPRKPTEPGRGPAEAIRRTFADAWGEMGSAWGVPPSLARVHGYFLAHRGVLTEREVREALGLSHRAASIAVAECESWGLIERVADQPRSGRRGPSATAYTVVADRWTWFQRIVEQRKLRETDPIKPRIHRALARAEAAAVADPDDQEVADLRRWLAELLDTIALVDIAVGLVARARPADIGKAFTILQRMPEESLDRLLTLFAELPDEELAQTFDAISRTSPTTARRILSVASRIARLGT
jgi:DNA-binding transcriptional regulator GbsR (MarR family)